MTLSTILLQAQAQGSGWTSIIMMVALIAIFYFFMISTLTYMIYRLNYIYIRNNSLII